MGAEIKRGADGRKVQVGLGTCKVKDKNREQGRIEGICSVANYSVGRDRADIIKILLSYFALTKKSGPPPWKRTSGLKV